MYTYACMMNVVTCFIATCTFEPKLLDALTKKIVFYAHVHVPESIF